MTKASERSMENVAQPHKAAIELPVGQLPLFEDPPLANTPTQLGTNTTAIISEGQSQLPKSRGDLVTPPDKWLWEQFPIPMVSALERVDQSVRLGRWDQVTHEFRPDRDALEREAFHPPGTWKTFSKAVADVGKFALINHSANRTEQTCRAHWREIRERKIGFQICLGMSLVQLEMETIHGKFQALRGQLLPSHEPTALRRFQRWFRILITPHGTPIVTTALLRKSPDFLKEWDAKRILKISSGFRSFKALLDSIHSEQNGGNASRSSPKGKFVGYRELLEKAFAELERCSANDSLKAEIRESLGKRQ